MIKTNELKRKWCSLVTVMTPMLMMYYIGIATVTLLDAVILATYLALLISKIKNGLAVRFDKYKILISFFMLYILTGYIFHLFFSSFAAVPILLRTGRYLLYLSWPIVVCGKYFDEFYALKWYRSICIFSTVYLIMQYLFLFICGKSIPGYLPFFTLARPELRDFTESLQMSAHARPRSIFAEPSQFGIYMSGYLSIMLLKEKTDFNKLLFLFLAAGLMLSASTTSYFGLILSIVIIIYNFIIRQKKGLKKNRIFVMITGWSVLIVIFFTQIERIIAVIDRALVRMPVSFHNRLEGYSLLRSFFSNKNSIFSWLLGIGMDVDVLNNITWTASTVKIVYYFGMTGTFMLLVLCVTGLIHLTSSKRCVFCIILFLGFFTEVLVSSWLMLFLPFIYPYNSLCSTERKKKYHFSMGIRI